jgi:hypothetical protein
MRMEAPVLDGDQRLRDVGRHVGQGHGLAAGHAAIGEQLAFGGHDLHIGRPVGNGPGDRAGHPRAIEGDDAGDRDTAPQAKHQRPVDQPAKQAEAAPRARPPRRLRRALTAFRCGFGGSLLPAAFGRDDAVVLAHRQPAGAALRRRPVEARFDPFIPAASCHACAAPSPFALGRSMDTKCGALRGG